MNTHITALAEHLGALLKARQLTLSTAESCTGGGLSYAITAIAGSSDWFEGGFVTYSNFSKQKLLNVSAETLNHYGAVSRETAIAMAEGALCQTSASLTIAVTGIAGPAGGSKTKPVGTVWFAWAGKQLETRAVQKIFSGTRFDIRTEAIAFGLQETLDILSLQLPE